MLKSFYYMFKTEKFWVKGLCYMGLVFISNLLTNYAQTLLPPCAKCAPPLSPVYWVCLISGMLLSLIPLGYVYSCIKSIIDSEEEVMLPFMNLKEDFVKGFKYAVSMLSLLLPLLVVVMLIIVGIAGVTLGSNLGAVISKTFLIFVILAFAFLLIGFNRLFAEEPRFSNFYRFKRVFELISTGKRRYLGYVSLICVMFIINMFLELFFGKNVALLGIGTTGALIITGILCAITGTYITFVISYLTARSIKKPEA